MFFRGTKVTLKDVHQLQLIDVQSYPFPWTRQEWEAVINEATDVRLYRIENIEIALWVGRNPSDEDIEDKPCLKDSYQLLKLGVMHSRQRRGLGTAMVHDVFRQARSWGKNRVITYVPEYLLDPHYPEYVGSWLAHPDIGFKTTGKIEFNAINRYNRDWDIIEYVAEVP